MRLWDIVTKNSNKNSILIYVGLPLQSMFEPQILIKCSEANEWWHFMILKCIKRYNKEY